MEKKPKDMSASRRGQDTIDMINLFSRTPVEAETGDLWVEIQDEVNKGIRRYNRRAQQQINIVSTAVNLQPKIADDDGVVAEPQSQSEQSTTEQSKTENVVDLNFDQDCKDAVKLCLDHNIRNSHSASNRGKDFIYQKFNLETYEFKYPKGTGRSNGFSTEQRTLLFELANNLRVELQLPDPPFPRKKKDVA